MENEDTSQLHLENHFWTIAVDWDIKHQFSQKNYFGKTGSAQRTDQSLWPNRGMVL